MQKGCLGIPFLCTAVKEEEVIVPVARRGRARRVALAIALDAHLVCGQPLANQEVGDRACTGLRQCLVVGIRADAVGVAHHHGVAILGFDVDDLLVEGVECLHPLRFELRLAKGKQHIRTQVEGLIHRLGSRGRRCHDQRRGHRHCGDGAIGVKHQLDGGGTDVADPAFGTAAHLVVVRIVPDSHHVAVAGLDVYPVAQSGGQPDPPGEPDCHPPR